MKKFRRLIYTNNLFVKIFLVLVISIIIVCASITYSHIHMSSNLFINTFSITNSKIINQITDQFHSFTDSIVSVSLEIETNGTIKQLLQEQPNNTVEEASFYYNITNEMEDIYPKVDPDDATMIIMSENNDVFNMNYAKWPVDRDRLANHEIIHETETSSNQITYHFEQSELTNNVPMIVASKALRLQSNDIYGYLLFALTERDLNKFYESYTSGGNNVLLVDRNGQIISSNQQERIGEYSNQLLHHAEQFVEQPEDYEQITVFDETYIFLSAYIPALDAYLVNLIDKDIIAENVIDTKQILFISIIVVSIAVLTAFLILRRMTVSISKLVNQISDMARYQFTKPLQETGGYETRKIAKAFNYMLNELHDYVQILIKTQEKQRKAELEMLQHQINPHFIYNTLASIKFFIQQDKKETAMETMDSFIALLQHSLSNIDETITVEQELEHLQNYVQINQARYGDRIKVNYLIAPDCLQLAIPKLIIQPFIENAFFHGFNTKTNGYIQVLIARKDDTLTCEIIDNGDGIKLEQLNNKLVQSKGKRQLFSGIGVKNVNERIQLLYGKHYGVEIDSELSKGTKVKITLPAKQLK
ncbi:sensor histidine kinase [Gracilibacillus sp. S3-1-1]|uniref:Sensor histidine kinase n=2 Tax=Bacteria TaxID=2 RepID=A0ACC6M316_9BACI|nr:sensor histidine kinase [Gracilibacillus sp. S3-1-1]MDX8045132.1 sensor histidine kinase [Gracilibacillus sp. S3-1-1]